MLSLVVDMPPVSGETQPSLSGEMSRGGLSTRTPSNVAPLPTSGLPSLDAFMVLKNFLLKSVLHGSPRCDEPSLG